MNSSQINETPYDDAYQVWCMYACWIFAPVGIQFMLYSEIYWQALLLSAAILLTLLTRRFWFLVNGVDYLLTLIVMGILIQAAVAVANLLAQSGELATGGGGISMMAGILFRRSISNFIRINHIPIRA
jgi:hypothetical protein